MVGTVERNSDNTLYSVETGISQFETDIVNRSATIQRKIVFDIFVFLLRSPPLRTLPVFGPVSSSCRI